jgi:hypothetical protein
MTTVDRRSRELRASDGFGSLPGAFGGWGWRESGCLSSRVWRPPREPASARARWPRWLALAAALLLIPACVRAETSGSDDCEATHPMNDAWFTGPMLANTAATAPRGHFLVEPYLYDVTTQGVYGPGGTRHSAPHANSYGSLTYIIYALTDTTGVGVEPTFGYNNVAGAPASTAPGVGDLTVEAQHRLAQFRPCRWMPTVSFGVQETLPTGRYDRLGDRTAAALGAGAYTVDPSLYSQMYFWMPNRRILRMRLNISDAFSHGVAVHDASVYGTSDGFSGTARPGSSFYLDNSWEYSATRRWVLALDATYRSNGNTRVSGSYPLNGPGSRASMVANTGWSDAWGLAPAVEYSWKPWIGVLLGTRLIAAGHNTSDTITPAIAVNIVH